MKSKVTVVVNVPAAAAWQLLGEEFADISKWFDAIFESSLDRDVGEGATRTSELKSGQVTEELTRFDPQSRALTYVVRSGLPSFMGTVENAWTIEAIDRNSCSVTSVITADMRWYAWPMVPMIKMNLRKIVRGMLSQLDNTTRARLSDNQLAV